MIRKRNNTNGKVKVNKAKAVEAKADKVKEYIYQNEITIDDTDELNYIDNVKNDPNNYVPQQKKSNFREPFNENKPHDINPYWKTIIWT